MENILEIDGKPYDVLVTSIEEKFAINYSSKTGRTIALGSRMVLDPLGTFYGHDITLCRKTGHEQEFDDLFEYISQPRRDGFSILAVHNQKRILYDAYVEAGARKVQKIDKKTGKVYWGELKLSIKPMEAQVLPL